MNKNDMDYRYWSKLAADSGKYIRFYNIKEPNFRSREIKTNKESVSGFLKEQGCSSFEFYGSIFALYLSRINRMDGCLLKTNLPADDPKQADRTTIVKVSVNKKDSFTDFLKGFGSALTAAAEHTKSDVRDYLNEELTFYAVHDLTGKKEWKGTEDGLVLMLNIYEDSIKLMYHSDVFPDVYAEHMVKNLEALTEAILSSPAQELNSADILSEEEKDMLAVFTKGKTIEVEKDGLLSKNFREQALAHPDAIAVDDGICTISYGELEKSSNSVADDLKRNHGIGPGSRVALMLPRTYRFAEMVIALHKVGAAYIPLDTRFPVMRIGYMLALAQADCLVTTRSIAETLDIKEKVICLEDLDQSADVDVEIQSRIDGLFAIIFTSGTTGVPKGVMYYNRETPWAIAAITDIFHFGYGDIIGSFFSFASVASFFVCAALYMGSTLRLFNDEEQKNSLLLVKALKEKHMNSLALPPAVGIPLYENEDLNLDYLLLAGAKLNELSRVERHTKLINAYGTTEIIFGLSKIYDQKDMKDGRVPVGKPAPNTWVYILDEDNHQMPVGVPGEICVSGRHCTRGYCNDVDQSEEHFVENPFAPGEIMYRTGDIGYYNFDGEVEVIGREDEQLSVRAFRVESGEILRIMKGFPEISDIYLDVDNDNLVAYYTASDALDLDQVKDALKNELPYYMIPSLFIKLEKIPLNLNGKIDRAKVRTVSKPENVEIADEVLRTVVEAFKEILKLDYVSVDDDFVSVGGNSLSAMKLQLKLNERLNVSLSANELIGLSTPKDVANYIRFRLNVHETFDEDRYSYDTPCPLSESQLNIYLDERVHDMGTAYNNPFILRFRDKNAYPADRIRRTINRLYQIYPVLKGRIRNADGVPSLVFDAEAEIAEGSTADIAAFVRQFDTEKGLSRFLIADDRDSIALCIDIHHLIFDGTSFGVILRRFASLLSGEDTEFVDKGLLRTVSFEELIRSGDMEPARVFFDEMLANRDDAYDLIPPVGAGSSSGYIHTFDLDKEKLGAFLRNHSITKNQFYAGVFAYTLSRFSGSEKVLFSLIEDGRGHIDLSQSVGMFVKTLPVLLDCSDRSVDAFLKDTSGLINSVMKYDLYPFRLLAGKYDLNANIQFQYSHNIFSDVIGDAGDDYEIEECRHDLDADFSFNILNSTDNKLTIRLLSRYPEEFVRRFTETYIMILREMMTADRLRDIRFTSDGDISLLDQYNQTETDVEYDSIPDAFNDSLSRYPENRLVEYNDVSYTYGEGAFLADQIRQRLLGLGVKAEDRVGFLVPRSELYMFSVLGILSTGAAYVPLDDNLPDERLSFMIRDAVTGCLIVSDDTLERAKKLAGEEATLVNISEIMKEEIETLDRLPFTSGDIAAILYTSGSTGIPKGVKIKAGSVLNLVLSHRKAAPLLPGDICALYASIGFDVSMEVLFSVLSSGACMDIIPDCKKLDIQALNRHFAEHGVTQVHLPAQMARLFIREISDTSLRDLVCGGEKLGQVSEIRDYRITDTYGPTEACVYVTDINLKEKIDPSSIGFVISNTKAYVLDKERRRVPVGAAGELYLSGPQLADGYLNRPEETARAFLPNPFEDSKKYETIYATGDVVRVLPDGSYGFIGRRDDQVKIRGNRLELSEVEAVIRRIDGVSDVTAQIRKLDGNNELIVYVVTEDPDNETAANRVLSYLDGRVPEFMVPSFVIRLDSIPLNVNGKVDRKALPEVDFGMLHAEYAAPRNELEERVVREFERVFELERIGIHDDFVRLGGDSLTAVKLVSVLGNTGITVGDILRLRTPAAIAGAMKDSQQATFADPEKYSYDGPCPLSESQLNVYLDEKVHDRGTAFNIPYIIRFRDRENCSPDRIRAALEELLTAYPVLRGRVQDKEGSPSMVFDAELKIREGSVDEIGSFVRPFELNKSLSRFMILRDEDATVLCVDFHHLIFDGVSMNVFLDSLVTLLQGNTIDSVDMGMLQEASLEEFLRSSGMEEAEDFYAHMLADRDEVYPMLPSVDGAKEAFEWVHTFDIDKKQLDSFLRKHSMTRNQYFMGVFAYTLSRFSGSEKVLFTLVEDGRGHMDLSRSIGMYVKLLPVLLDCKDQKVDVFLSYVSDLTNSVMKYDLVPFRTLASRYEVNAGTLFQYAHSLYMDTMNRDGQSIEPEPLPQDPDSELSFYVFDNEDDGLILRIKSSSRYSEDFIRRFAESYELILRDMMRAEQLTDIHFTTEKDLALLDGWNRTDEELTYEDILEPFNVNLQKYPDYRLVVCNDASCTFAEGAYIADRIRRELIRLGVKADDRVSFLIPRSEAYLLCILGIMSAGAAYVPLDDKLPDERIAFMLRDTESRVLIVADDTLKRAEALAPEETLFFNISDIMKGEIGTISHLPVSYGHLASIIYTSGSTGRPKGVKVTRRALCNIIEDHVNEVEICPGDACGLYSSIGFDMSLSALFSVIYAGACLDVIPDCKKLDIQALAEHISSHHITHAMITTQIAKLFISQVEETTLKVLVPIGEKLGRIREKRAYRIVDEYGPTEACCYVTGIDVRDKIDPSSVGRVVHNTKAYVLDSELRRLPIGAIGGLYLSGVQLADGYLNRPEETAKAFLSNPYETGDKYGKLYYTGDVARVLPDGTYGIVGRRDGQVKVRGNRVELTEIEAVLRKMDGVSDVTVKTKSHGGNNELIAYIVSDEKDEAALKQAVSGYLTGRVPDYMIPSFVIRMDSIPLNVNGKVDKKALPEVDFDSLHAEYAAPRNEMEARIVREFERVFELERIGIYDDFMSLGGDSLTAVKLLSGLRDYGIKIADILSLRTPAAIAEGVEELSPDTAHFTLESGCPLNNSQMTIYKDFEKRGKNDTYMVPVIIPIDKRYNRKQIRRALDIVFKAHPVMSMHVEVKNGNPWLVMGSKPEVRKGVTNLTSMIRHLEDEFDIFESLSKHVVIRTPGKRYLVSVFHHICFDLISGNVFRRDFLNALKGVVPKRVDTDFLKLAAFQQQLRNSEGYEQIMQDARTMFGNLKEVGFYRNPEKMGKAGFIMRELSVSRKQVKSFTDRFGTNKNILFTSALALTLSRLTGKDDVLFGINENGRDRSLSYNAIGLYMNVVPMVAHVDRRNMRTCLKSLSDQYYKYARLSHYPFGPLALESGVSPIIEFQFLPDWIIDDGGYDHLPVSEKVLNKILSRMTDLVVEAHMEVVEGKDGYTLRIYHSGYYSREMIERLADTYQEILSRMIRN